MFIASSMRQLFKNKYERMKLRLKYIILAISVAFTACGTESGIVTVPKNNSTDTTSTVNAAKIYLTSSDRSNELTLKSAALLTGQPSGTSNTILLDTLTRYQTMDGFGAAITGSTCYNLLRMTDAARHAFLLKTFSTSSGYGFSYVRVAIGCSDFSLSEYTCCDKEGIDNFALTNEELNFVIPVMKEILAINPAVKVMAAPWTAPRWMKVSQEGGSVAYNSWTSGHVATKYYQDYATYFVKWIQAFQQNGIDIYAVTPQNEPLNGGNSASTLMTWKEQQAFVRDALGPKFAAAGLTTKIYAYDHNYDQYSYPLNIYQDAKAAAYIAGAAFHNYVGDKNMLNNVHAESSKGLLFTEASIGEWCDGRNLASRLMDDMNEVALGTVNNWCTGVIVWNLMLNTDKGPNRNGGCQSCYGAVDISSANYTNIIKNSHYFIIAHLSAVVQPGAQRIATTNGVMLTGVVTSAFLNPDGSYAVVLANNNTVSQTVTLNDGTRYFNFLCPGRSVASFTWKKH